MLCRPLTRRDISCNGGYMLERPSRGAMAAYDRLYRKILAATKFFSKGWGPAEAYKRLFELFPVMNDRSQLGPLLADYTHSITTAKPKEHSWGSQIAGQFLSPLAALSPGLLPEVSTTARFELLLPKSWPTRGKPIYIHLAGTGDHGFWRRYHMTAIPLLKDEGIGALLLENPFYGSRKPLGQRRSQLNHVSDLLVMGLALIFECITLTGWLERAGFGPMGLTGTSMGGHNVSLTACVHPGPIPVVPCLSWCTAASVFTEGILSESVCWDILEDQLYQAKGKDDKLMNIFQVAAEKQISGRYGDILESFNQSYDNNGLFSHHPTIVPVQPRVYRSEAHRETVSLMQAVLNAATHFNSFPQPDSPELAQFIAAKDDLYIPRHNVLDVRELWPGCQVDYIAGGHVSSIVTQQAKLRRELAKTMGKVLNDNTLCS